MLTKQQVVQEKSEHAETRMQELTRQVEELQLQVDTLHKERQLYVSDHRDASETTHRDEAMLDLEVNGLLPLSHHAISCCASSIIGLAHRQGRQTA